MKTLARIVIIVTAFAIAMGLIYLAVNVGGSSSAASPAFERREGFAPQGERGELRGDGGSLTRLTFGMIKNISIVAIFVALITIPRGFRQKMKRQAASAQISL
jgi:hypothetical protein